VFLDRLPAGFTSLTLKGPAGIGKTVLWQAAKEIALQRGWTVLPAQPGWAEAPLLFSGLTDLFGHVPGPVLDALAPVQRRALEGALLRTDSGEGPVDPRTLSTAVLSVLQQLALGQPVLVAIDDVQWLDRPSAACLGFALRRLSASPVGFLASARAGPHPLPVLDALASEPVEELTVGPLPTDAVEEMLVRKFPGRMRRRVIVKVARQSDGNPFYAVEIAREVVRVGDDARSGPLPVPAALGDLLKTRLDELPARTRAALLAASCLDSPRTGLVDAEALGSAEEAGLVELERGGRIRFSHPLIAAAVCDSALPNRRRAVHRALADRVDDLEERARHLALGADGPDIEIAGHLDDAAKLAHARGSPEASAELVELALQLTPGADERGRLDRLLTGAGFNFEAGDLKRAQQLLEELLPLAYGGPLRAHALRLMAQLRFRTGSFSEAGAFALEALQAAAGDLGLSAALEMDITFFLAMQGDFPGALPHIEAAITKARRHGVEPVEAEALATRTMFQFLTGQGLAGADLERALSLEDPTRMTPGMLRPRLIAGQIVLWTRSAEESAGMFLAQRSEALEQGRENDVSPLGSYLAWALLWKGDVEPALSIATESLRLARQLEDPFSICLSLFVSALAGSYHGDAEDARAYAQEAVSLSLKLKSQLLAVFASWALGFLELSLGNYAAVEAVLGPVSAALGDLSHVDPVLAIFVPDEIEALLHLGQLERAEQLLVNFERQAAAVGRDWALSMAARCRALFMVAQGDVEGALVLLEKAVRSPAGRELAIERARSLLELGRLQRRLKQRRLARASLQEAIDAFDVLPAPVWAAWARAELGRTGSRSAPAGLTATEESIARLAADGLTNQAIARRCFVNVKTVEANLARAYRKLGVTSRAQLARALDALPAPSSE
jgi:DNA-binding CsgD family transcriptional regulator